VLSGEDDGSAPRAAGHKACWVVDAGGTDKLVQATMCSVLGAYSGAPLRDLVGLAVRRRGAVGERRARRRSSTPPAPDSEGQRRTALVLTC